jgi:predicted deacylase
MNKAAKSKSPLIELQKVNDNVLAFYGIADDRIDSENVRNIIKAGKRIERIDMYARLGVGMRITKEYGDQLTDGIFHLMEKNGVWDGKTAEPRTPIISRNPDDVSYLNARVGGLVVPKVHHWEELTMGDVIGSIIDPLSGKVLDYVKSPVDGILFTIREYPIVDEGALVGRLLRKEAYHS